MAPRRDRSAERDRRPRCLESATASSIRTCSRSSGTRRLISTRRQTASAARLPALLLVPLVRAFVSIDDGALDHLVSVYGRPGAFTASIAWYRAGAGSVATSIREQPPSREDIITVPTTVLGPNTTHSSPGPGRITWTTSSATSHSGPLMGSATSPRWSTRPNSQPRSTRLWPEQVSGQAAASAPGAGHASCLRS